MKKKDLMNAYGKAPQSFHNSIVRTLNTLDTGTSSVRNTSQVQAFSDFDEENILTIQTKKSSFPKIFAVCALAAAVAVGGAVSAKTILPKFSSPDTGTNTRQIPAAQPVQTSTPDQPEITEIPPNDRHITLVLTQAENAPEYAKMSINYLPDGVIEDNGKYSLNGNHEEMCFTIVGERVVGTDVFTDDDVIGTVVSAEELNIGGNTAILANFNVDPYSRRFYIFYEDMAVLVTGYVTKDVPDEELRKVLENITVEECDEGEHNLTPLSLANEFNAYEEEKSEELEEDYETIWSEVKLGQKISFDDSLEKLYKEYYTCNKCGIDYTVDKIEVLDNISDLHYTHFDGATRFEGTKDISQMVDENGNFTSYIREYYQWDEEEFENKLVKTDTATRCLVYASVTFTNTTDEPRDFELFHFNMARFKNVNGKLEFYDESTNPDVPELYNCGEVIYNDDYDDENGCYYVYLDPHSTKTVHIGFLADTDQLDNLYLFTDESYTGSHIVFNPEKSAFLLSDTPECVNACIKVR